MSTYGFIEVVSTHGNSHLVHLDMVIDIKHKKMQNGETVYHLFFQNPTLDFEIDEKNYKLIKEVVENN